MSNVYNHSSIFSSSVSPSKQVSECLIYATLLGWLTCSWLSTYLHTVLLEMFLIIIYVVLCLKWFEAMELLYENNYQILPNKHLPDTPE